MPSIITFDQIRRYQQTNLRESRESLNSAIRKSINFSKMSHNVFLSYSSKDKEYLSCIIMILENHGGNPYVDMGDERLPNPPSVETARILKDTIINCNRFVVFVTSNSKDSKWVPWELGISDGAKNNNDIAVFPSAESSYNTEWTEQEYLGLYRKIVYGKLDGYKDEVWMVWNKGNNTATELSKWLTS